MPNKTILLADDDHTICTVLTQALRRQGYQVMAADNAQTLLNWAKAGKGDAVITDVLMPKGNGLEFLPRIREARPELPVIVISAQNTLLTAVKATELGAFDYLPKPFDLNELMGCLSKAIERRPPSPLPALPPDEVPLIGSSPAMQEIYRALARLVQVDLTVMIHGESGTGKELIARALHQLGKRKNGAFIAVNMAAIPKELVESELFGHEKGAFTGAAARKGGMFEQAEGGTLFLDEIGDMPLDAQTKLLRVLQQGEYTAVGGSRPIKTDARIICATHRDLQQLVQNGEFREDLYYRLHVVPLRAPPLRERKEDIPALANFFLHKAAQKGLPHKQLDASAQALLQRHAWPGNVRELENLLYRLSALFTGPLITGEAVHRELGDPGRNSAHDKSSLYQQIRSHIEAYFGAHQGGFPPSGLYERVLRVVEKPLIEVTLHATGNNQLKAASILGLNRNTLRKKITELGIGKDSEKAEEE